MRETIKYLYNFLLIIRSNKTGALNVSCIAMIMADFADDKVTCIPPPVIPNTVHSRSHIKTRLVAWCMKWSGKKCLLQMYDPNDFYNYTQPNCSVFPKR